MKIVINVCFGGFGLSGAAEQLYAEKSGFTLYRYNHTKYKWQDGEDLFEKMPVQDGSIFSHTYTKDYGDSFSTEEDSDAHYWSTYDIKRDDPILVEVVEELGDKADGTCAKLKVVEIPDGVSWDIDEYDGTESIHESHESWS